jgi:uncharacterized protein YbjT (DUF2867 family)
VIVVLGPTGTVGCHVVADLVTAGRQVRVFTRTPARARFDKSVEIAEGDLGAPATVRAALVGADGVFVVSTGPDALAHELTVADAVRRYGVRRVVKLSSVAAMPPVTDSYGAAHAASERAFAESGAEWTALRAAGFMSNVLHWKSSIKSEGRAYQPYGAIPRAVIDPRDVAAVAVACLTTTGHHGQAYQLTGPEALTAPEQAAKISAALGRPVEFVDVAPELAARSMTSSGMPAQFARSLLASLADPDPHRGGLPLPTVRQITGHSPMTFDAWLARHLAELTG